MKTFVWDAWYGVREDRPESEDCWRMCLSQLLGLSRDKIPDFVHYSPYSWLAYTESWLGDTRNLSLVPVAPGETGTHLVYGPSPRKGFHTVLYRDGKMVYDPHPSQNGLAPGDRLRFAIRPSGLVSA